jgi:hypothetical protein
MAGDTLFHFVGNIPFVVPWPAIIVGKRELNEQIGNVGPFGLSKSDLRSME